MLHPLGPPLYSRRSVLAPLAFAAALLCAALAGCGGQAELDSAAAAHSQGVAQKSARAPSIGRMGRPLRALVSM
jgi:hypothetical protein